MLNHIKLIARVSCIALAGGVAVPLIAGPVSAQTTEEHVSFSGQSFALAFSETPSAGYVRSGFIPAGQALARYEDMLIRETVAGVLVRDAVAQQVAMLEGRRGTDPVLNYEILTNEATGEIILDFLLSEVGADGVQIVEWNAYRYQQRDDGVVLLGISRRGYGAQATAFLQALGAERPRDIDALAAAGL